MNDRPPGLSFFGREVPHDPVAIAQSASYVLEQVPGDFMSFGLYILGFCILIVGLAIGAHLAHMPDRWIAVGVIVMVGIGIVKGVSSARRPDPS